MLDRLTGFAVPPPTEDGLLVSVGLLVVEVVVLFSVVIEPVLSVEELLLDVLLSVVLEVSDVSLMFSEYEEPPESGLSGVSDIGEPIMPTKKTTTANVIANQFLILMLLSQLRIAGIGAINPAASSKNKLDQWKPLPKAQTPNNPVNTH